MDFSSDMSFEIMYMPTQSVVGGNDSLLDFHQTSHHNPASTPSHSAFGAAVVTSMTPGHNQSITGVNGTLEDAGGMLDMDFGNGSWPGCATVDVSVSPPTTALFQFLVNGLGISIVAVLGIFGNILSAIVLSRPQMKSSVTCLLLGLAFCDTLLISVSILVFSMPFLNDYVHSAFLWRYQNVYFTLWVPYLYPVSITAQTGSVYLTLAVTIERYIAVCHSLKARSICTWRRARICVATVFLFSIFYNLPRWWEVLSIPLCDPVNNMTIYMNGKSNMRDNPTYVTVYINWAYLVVMYLIPFSGLVVFNLAIYRQVSQSMVRKANRERQQLSKLQRREMGLATMLLCVVVVFLLCNVLPLVNNILESFYDTSVDQLVALSNFLVVVNSSVNFVIYCTCGERFRRLLLRLCRDFIWCRLGGTARNNYRGSLYRKSHYYRDSKNLGANNNLVSAYNPGGAEDDDLIDDPGLGRTTTTNVSGGDFEEMSMASVANHTCLTTANGGTNGSVVVDLSSKSKNGNGYRGAANSRERNKTIPLLHVHHHHHHHHNHRSNGNSSTNGHHVNNHQNNHHNHHHSRHHSLQQQPQQQHPLYNSSNGSSSSNSVSTNNSITIAPGPVVLGGSNNFPLNAGTDPQIPSGTTPALPPPSILINNGACSSNSSSNGTTGNNGRAHVGRGVSSPAGPT